MTTLQPDPWADCSSFQASTIIGVPLGVVYDHITSRGFRSNGTPCGASHVERHHVCLQGASQTVDIVYANTVFDELVTFKVSVSMPNTDNESESQSPQLPSSHSDFCEKLVYSFLCEWRLEEYERSKTPLTGSVRDFVQYQIPELDAYGMVAQATILENEYMRRTWSGLYDMNRMSRVAVMK